MKHVKRMSSSNAVKFAMIDLDATQKQTFISSKFGILELFVNPSIDVGISLDKQSVYRLTPDLTDIKSKFSNSYVCIELIIEGVATKCSRNVLINILFGEQDSIIKTKPVTDKITMSKVNCIKNNFDATKTYTEASFVKNPDINVYFDMNTQKFYTYNNSQVSDARGLKSGVYVTFMKDNIVNRVTMLQDHVVAMMYGIEVPKGSMVKLIDETKPLIKSNISVIGRSQFMSKPKNLVQKQNSTRNLVPTYITEDYSKFTNRDDAYKHQIKVDKAKEIVSLIMNTNNSGHALAEKAFLVVMDMDRKNVKYEHFVDVLNNEKGVLEVKKESMKVDLSVNIDTLFIDPTNKETATNLVLEINERINTLKSL